ncbi:restriction endonuclease subunit S [Isoptericola sp. NPDC058082]|uniref:restriction endonuclease subunit S n=1 Tax=Isoptericola sp. NPDC058082 TaxID=3346331 RepID=UPI0036E84230
MLPTGWRVEAVASLAQGGLFVDGDWVESKDQDPSGGVRLTQLADVGVGVFRDRSDRWMRDDQAARLNCTFIEPDDVLIARMPDPIGRACLAPAILGRAVTAVDVAILRPRRRDVYPRYLMWAINSPQVHERIAKLQSGTTRKRVSRKNLATVQVPVPPLEEQRRIVEILEDHLSRLDAGTTQLARAEARLGLTVDAAIATASELADAPTHTLGDVLGTPLSNGRSVPTADEGFPVLRLTAMRDGVIDPAERKTGAWTAADAASFLVARGDVFAARGNGSLRLVGRAARVIDDPDPVAYPDTMIRMRPNPDLMRADFLTAIWNSRTVRSQIERRARTTAGIYKVNQKDLLGILVPLPSLEDQAAFIARVDDLAYAVRGTMTTVTTARRRADALRRSVLAAAFSGQLAGTESDIERVEEMAGV